MLASGRSLLEARHCAPGGRCFCNDSVPPSRTTMRLTKGIAGIDRPVTARGTMDAAKIGRVRSLQWLSASAPTQALSPRAGGDDEDGCDGGDHHQILHTDHGGDAVVRMDGEFVASRVTAWPCTLLPSITHCRPSPEYTSALSGPGDGGALYLRQRVTAKRKTRPKGGRRCDRCRRGPALRREELVLPPGASEAVTSGIDPRPHGSKGAV